MHEARCDHEKYGHERFHAIVDACEFRGGRCRHILDPFFGSRCEVDLILG